MQNLATDIFAELLSTVSLCSVNSLESFELCCFLAVRDLTLIHWWLRCKQFTSFGLMILDLYPSLLSSHFFQWRCHLLLLHFSAIPLTSKTLCSSLSPTLTWDKILVGIPVPTQCYKHAFGEAGDHLGFLRLSKGFYCRCNCRSTSEYISLVLFCSGWMDYRSFGETVLSIIRK